MTGKSNLNCLIVILFFCAIRVIHAQENNLDLKRIMIPQLKKVINQSGTGTKATAMGGAFTAIADDPTATEWNPAGLVQSRQSSAFLSGRFSFGSLSADTPKDFEKTHSLTGSDRGEFYLNFVGFAIPFNTKKRSVVGGIAVRSLSDMAGNTEWKVTENDSNKWQYGEKVTGGLYAMSSAIGVNVLQNLALGMSINFVTGRYKVKNDTIITKDNSTENIWAEDENKLSGTSIDLGVFWQALPNLSFGSKLSLPYTLHLTKSKHSDSTAIGAERDATMSLEIPTRFAFGASVQPMQDLIFALDYHIKPWAKSQMSINDYQEDRIFDSANSFHTGVEYMIRTRDSLLPIRLGFYISPTQLYNETQSDTTKGERIINNILTAGMGVMMNGFNLEFSFDYHLTQYKKAILSKGDPAFRTSEPLEINHSRYRFTISATVKI